MKTVGVKIDETMLKHLNVVRGEKSMSEFLREIIENYFHQKDRDPGEEMKEILDEFLTKKMAAALVAAGLFLAEQKRESEDMLLNF